MPRNESKIILHLCADIGSDSKPYENAGYDVIRIGKEIGVEKFPPPQRVRHYRKSAMYGIFFCKNQFKESEGH